MAALKYLALLVIIYLQGASAGELCYTRNREFEWCDWGCCEDYDNANSYCCEDSSAGMIVGIVIGCVVLVSIIVAVVIAVCCCLRKQRGRQGVVYQNNQAGTTTVVTGVHQPYSYGGQTATYPVQPQGYPGPQAQGYTGQQPPYPQQAPIQTAGMQPGTDQKWEQYDPPAYNTIN